MPAPQIGELMQPSNQGAMAPIQGPVPTTPEAHQGLVQQWTNFLARPDVRVAMTQFGTTLLSNLGTPGGLGQQVGTALGDAGQAAGRNVAANQEAQNDAQKNQVAAAELQQGQQGLEQRAKTAEGELALGAERNKLLEGQLTQAGVAEANRTAMENKRLALEAQNSANTAAFQKLQIALQREDLAARMLGTQTPKERALLSLATQIAAMERDWAVTNPDTPFDSAGAMERGMARIDQMFPSGAAPTMTSPAGGQTPQAGTPSPSAEAIQALKAGKGTDEQFDEIFGPGAAKKARGDGATK